MKKLPIIIVVVVVLAAIAGFVIVSGNKDDKSNGGKSSGGSSATTPSKTSYKAIKACDILTPEVAKQVAGPDAETTATPDTQSNSINVSNCSYYSVANKSSASLLARSPLDKAGVESNDYQFTDGLPSGSQKVEGYGDDAYWSPEYGQLNILQDGTWYILSAGQAQPSARSLAQAQQFANLIKQKL